MLNPMNMDGRVIMITGAAQGIGRGVAQKATELGATLVLVDLNKTATVRNEEQETKCRWSPWDGVSLTGWPVRTWVMGHTVFCDGQIDESRTGTEARFDHQRGGYWST